jgi:hypothetical protein
VHPKILLGFPNMDIRFPRSGTTFFRLRLSIADARYNRPGVCAFQQMWYRNGDRHSGQKNKHDELGSCHTNQKVA